MTDNSPDRGPHRVARFMTVSEERFLADVRECLPHVAREEALKAYHGIQLPRRATAGSSGYDIRTPFGLRLRAGEDVVIPTGLRAEILNGWWLMLMPRSGLGFKLYTRLANTVGNIDSDYFGAKNEGHILVKLRLELTDGEPDRAYDFAAGSAICQGVFLPYGITYDDDAASVRVGGFGSTGG